MMQKDYTEDQAIREAVECLGDQQAWFDEHGNILKPFPAECVADCSAAGSVDESVTHWTKELGFMVPEDRTREYLIEFGAWDRDELNGMDQTELAERVLWIACGDLKESGEWFGLQH